MSLQRSFLSLILLIGLCGTAHGGVTVDDLRCEYRVDPLGIDVANPRLSWILESGERAQRQSAYRILVADSAEALNR